MTMHNSGVNLVPLTPPPNFAAQKLGQLQADLVSMARSWAADEVGAAMAHQLNEPLTALLFYLHEVREQFAESDNAHSGSNSMRAAVENALRETQRVCDIMERIGHRVDARMGTNAAVARGREAIDMLTKNSGDKHSDHTPGAVNPIQQLLTPREREVLALIVGGASNKEGARRLTITTRTFEVHRAHIMEKLGAKNAADLVRMALATR